MKVLVYYKYSNPYGRLLYDALARRRPGFTSRFAPSASPSHRALRPIAFTFELIRSRAAGFRLLHIHWPDFTVPNRVPAHRVLSLISAYICLTAARLLRYQVVWTVHNATPHETQTSNDLAVARYCAAHADAKIVHSASTIDQMRELNINVERSVVIPHGNYADVYPDMLTDEEARACLGLLPDDLVVLFFGRVRTYKGVGDLVRTFSNIRRYKAKLIVAGPCDEQALRRELLASASESIRFRLEHIPDEEVATYLRSADVMCAPFRSMTTSGSVMLALTFGKPIVAPLLGTVADLPSDVGWLYEPSDPHGLEESLRCSLSDAEDRERRRNAARVFGSSQTWESIADRTFEVYDALLGSSDPERPASD